MLFLFALSCNIAVQTLSHVRLVLAGVLDMHCWYAIASLFSPRQVRGFLCCKCACQFCTNMVLDLGALCPDTNAGRHQFLARLSRTRVGVSFRTRLENIVHIQGGHHNAILYRGRRTPRFLILEMVLVSGAACWCLTPPFGLLIGSWAHTGNFLISRPRWILQSQVTWQMER